MASFFNVPPRQTAADGSRWVVGLLQCPGCGSACGFHTPCL